METLTHAPVLARFGYAVSDPTRARILLALSEAPGYPSGLAESLSVSRQSMSNHLTCLRGCGLVVAVPDGRRMRYELADARLGHAITDLLGVVLAVDPACCAPGGGVPGLPFDGPLDTDPVRPAPASLGRNG
ncbi:ArsR/SmtB family transcription factor [Arthrobacter sp. TS-15]|uniref:ArsR/SmtB family transcription factor n=1 Tax=Arthrobacter sp. TS-15 TaxID=2510797 RepID=UPI001EE85553|nr:winged helix-turn-helix domain-containing protein [Arthrobacter sp. TS-15]